MQGAVNGRAVTIALKSILSAGTFVAWAGQRTGVGTTSTPGNTFTEPAGAGRVPPHPIPQNTHMENSRMHPSLSVRLIAPIPMRKRRKRQRPRQNNAALFRVAPWGDQRGDEEAGAATALSLRDVGRPSAHTASSAPDGWGNNLTPDSWSNRFDGSDRISLQMSNIEFGESLVSATADERSRGRDDRAAAAAGGRNRRRGAHPKGVARPNPVKKKRAPITESTCRVDNNPSCGVNARKVDLRQPQPFQAIAAVCRRVPHRGSGTDPNGES